MIDDFCEMNQAYKTQNLYVNDWDMLLKCLFLHSELAVLKL